MTLDGRTALRVALVLGLVGAVCGIVGDLCLTYSTEVPGAVPYAWGDVTKLVRAVPPGRARLGHALGVFGLQLSVWGFVAVLYGARPAGPRWTWPALLVVVFVIVVGCVYHGQLALVGAALRMADAAGVATDPAARGMVDELERLVWPPLAAVGVGVAFLSLWLPAVVLTRPTLYPRWFAALSPGPVMVALVGLAKLLAPEPVRLAVELTVFNLVSLLLIAVATPLLWRHDPSARAVPG